MKYRKLGTTGLEVSALSYGASALGGVFSQVNEGDGIRAALTAFEHGINYVDVSPAYGDTRAETVLGKALQHLSRDQYTISTKAGKFCTPGGYGDHVFDFSEKALRRSVEESLGRLKCGHLDVVYLHDIEYYGEKYVDQALTEGLETLAKMKQEGLIRFYGVATYPMGLWKRIVEQCELDVIMTHSHYCLSDIQLLDLIEPCKRNSIGIVNSAPLLMGVLTSRGAADWFPMTQLERDAAKKAVQFCLDNGTTIEQLAVQFAVSNEDIPTTLTSSSNPQRIIQSIRNSEITCDMELVAKVQEILSPIVNRDWDFGNTCK